MLNEPRIGPQTDSPPPVEQWRAWALAMNQTIALVRRLGAVNVIVADGLEASQELSGAPRLSDRLHQVVYAAHPYALQNMDEMPGAWKQKFGDFSRESPVIISEWGIGYHCDANTASSTVAFLNYLQENQIGLEIVTKESGIQFYRTENSTAVVRASLHTRLRRRKTGGKLV